MWISRLEVVSKGPARLSSRATQHKAVICCLRLQIQYRRSQNCSQISAVSTPKRCEKAYVSNHGYLHESHVSHPSCNTVDDISERLDADRPLSAIASAEMSREPGDRRSASYKTHATRFAKPIRETPLFLPYNTAPGTEERKRGGFKR